MSKKIYIGNNPVAGSDGRSAYQVWLDQGNVGTEADFLASLKGEQGNSGYSGAAGELEVVNNLTDGGATAALSAQQGVVLAGQVSQLGQELGTLSGGHIKTGVSYRSTGAEGQAALWFVGTDYIPVKSTDTIVWNPGLAGGSSYCLVCYNSNKEVISYYAATATERTITPTIHTALAFIRPSFALSNIGNAKIIINGKEAWKTDESIGYISRRVKIAEEQLLDKADLEKVTTGKNLFDKSNLLAGYISTTGSFDADASGKYWASNFIPVVAGEFYTIQVASALTGKGLRCLDDNGNIYKALAENGTTEIAYYNGMSQTQVVKIPDGCTKIQFNVIFNNNGNADDVQIEAGKVATAIVPYEYVKLLKESQEPVKVKMLSDNADSIMELVGLISRDNTLVLNLTPQEDSYIISPFNATYDAKMTMRIRSTTYNKYVFNFYRFYLVDKSTGVETLVKDCTDDICPATFSLGYIGGNHALFGVNKINNTNKTFADIGSIWSDGANTFVLVEVDSVNGKIGFISENKSTYPEYTRADLEAAGGTLTHVSGATNTSAITYTSRTIGQWYPCVGTSFQRIYADGKELTEDGTYKFNELKITEVYDVINPANVLEEIKLGVGTFDHNPTTEDFYTTADKMARHSNVYFFKSATECIIAADYLIYQNLWFGHYGYTQSNTPADTNTLKMYIPKAKSLNNGADAVDFRTIVDAADGVGSIKTNDFEVPALPPDRFLQFNNTIGVYLAYLFDYGIGGDERVDNIAGTAFNMVSGLKEYPYGWCVNDVVPAFSHKSMVIERRFIDKAEINTNGVVQSSVYEYNNALYINLDFNAAGLYEVDIPQEYQGKEITIFEKRDNVTLLNSIAEGKLLFKVETSSPMYGYFVGKINP